MPAIGSPISSLSSASATGIKSLKVGYNKVFGYYIEISRGAADKAPEDYIRKQTLVNGERYITPEMKEYETLVLNAEENIHEIELRLFREICAAWRNPRRSSCGPPVRSPNWMCYSALAEVAALSGYVRPEITQDGGSRHPRWPPPRRGAIAAAGPLRSERRCL